MNSRRRGGINSDLISEPIPANKFRILERIPEAEKGSIQILGSESSSTQVQKTTVGSLMDSNAMEKLEKQSADMELKIQPMQNIWTREVNYTNPLREARKVDQELLN
ncbi:hypothetical protein Acr_00g0026810 [Actinidia rufa]|uniref:Uncharacterized protein n=1 Tax=Actinidia rufa TaxID=165716 RepID=A0A7J0DDR2_9ERIC|nr:hypothetical protein Acr_00g0026810 [Actinidia rufa]